MKSKLFAEILDAVAEATELSKETILSKTRTEECVAARALFVHFCCTKGVPTCAIKDFLQRRRNDCISRYESTFETFHRSSSYFRNLVQNIEHRLSASRA